MTKMVKRWYRSRRNQALIFVIIILCIIYYINLQDSLHREPDLDITRSLQGDVKIVNVATNNFRSGRAPFIKNRNSVIAYIENRLQEALKEDKGTGCEIPQLDPFAKEVTQFDKQLPKITCPGQDWVKCYLSECKVVREILETTKDIECTYRDIIYESDQKYVIGPPTTVRGEDAYILTRSDHVKIKCTGKHINNSLSHPDFLSSKWTGHSLGFRTTVERKPTPPGREDSINVLIFGFDSTSRNGFIRKMPKSYEFLTKELKATVLNGYNIVGDGTPAALFPILTGKTELELPDVRKKMKNNGTLDSMPFIFYKLKEDGYRTAYFEDMPWVGTFQYRFNGFRHQPADHYLRDFYLEQYKNDKKYCVGDTPQYKLMMNITDQFLQLDGKRFCFTFIADITHDDFNLISTADEDMVDFLKTFRDRGRMEDTMLIVMGDHGPRFANVRETLQGKLEERLPLMAVLLPRSLQLRRGHAQAALARNADALATPHDVHATLLDALDLTQHYNTYRVPGADFTRALTLFEPIPRNRSCSEAGVEPHWCACVQWKNVSEDDKLYRRSAEAFVDYINSLTEPVRDLCVPRTLTATAWVLRQRANSRLLQFVAARDADGYVGKFADAVKLNKENYQIKIIVGPGRGVYEGSMTYLIKEDKFIFDSRDISRTNAYNNEPSCISATHPHLNMYCFCNG